MKEELNYNRLDGTPCIESLSVEPCEQSPAKLAKTIVRAMVVLATGEDVDRYVREEILVLHDLIKPVLKAIEENEEMYNEFLNKKQT